LANEGSLSEAESVVEAADLKLKMVKEKVKKFVKQQKLRFVGKLVQQATGDEPWGPAIQVKVQTRMFIAYESRSLHYLSSMFSLT